MMSSPPLISHLETEEDAGSVHSSVNSVPGDDDHSFHATDSTTSGKASTHRSKEEESSESEKLKLAQKETKAVFRLRLLVFLVLFLAAGKFMISDLLFAQFSVLVHQTLRLYCNLIDSTSMNSLCLQFNYTKKSRRLCDCLPDHGWIRER